MPSPATEVVSFPLPAGAEIKNPDSAAGKVFKDVLGTLFQQEGYQRSYFGRQVENSNTIDLYIGENLTGQKPRNAQLIHRTV